MTKSKTTKEQAWRISREPFSHLSAFHNGVEVGEAVHCEADPGEGLRWYAFTRNQDKTSGALKTKREAIRWLLEHCPAGTAVNEMSAQWERIPSLVKEEA
jgi:hypothetical protein